MFDPRLLPTMLRETGIATAAQADALAELIEDEMERVGRALIGAPSQDVDAGLE